MAQYQQSSYNQLPDHRASFDVAEVSQDSSRHRALSEDDGVECAVCGATPEDVLILTCEHNLCLTCAARNLNSNQRSNSDAASFQSVICDFCGIATVLDPASATELISLHTDLQIGKVNDIMDDKSPLKQDQMFAPTAQNPQSRPQSQPVYEQPIYVHQTNHSQQPYLTQQKYHQPESQGNMRASHKQLYQTQYCSIHEDQELTYFDYDCPEAGPICSECVIHGDHRGHNVALLKKAQPWLAQQISDLEVQINGRLEDLGNQEHRLDQHKRDIGEQAHQARQCMANAFEDLRQRIDAKERELLQNSDEQISVQMGKIEQSQRLVDGRRENLSGALNTLLVNQDQGHDDAIHLACFYSEQFPELQNRCLIDTDLPQLKEIKEWAMQDPVSSKPRINVQSVNGFIQNIEAINLVIDTFGKEPTPLETAQGAMEQAEQEYNIGEKNRKPLAVIPEQNMVKHHSNYMKNKVRNSVTSGGQSTGKLKSQRKDSKTIFDVAYGSQNGHTNQNRQDNNEQAAQHNAQSLSMEAHQRAETLQAQVAHTMQRLKQQQQMSKNKGKPQF